MKGFIKILLREALMSEAEINQHTWDRIKGRIDIMSDDDLPMKYRETIIDNFHKVKDTDFPAKKSYAVLLGEFRPNPNSEYLYKDPKNGNFYYRVLNDPILKDSTGNQFWVIVRGNRVHTFMLRKEWQSKPPALNAQKLDVDHSINNMDKFVADMNRSKQATHQKREEPIVNINGVKWMVNPKDETIHKKNNPKVKHRIEDMFDEVDSTTQEKIMAYL